jgi:hypothetical protein
MKKIIALLLLFAATAWAADPKPAEYTITVHVSSSRLIVEPQAIGRAQLLNVTIDGKKYELESGFGFSSLLALGDYKAKVVKEEHPSAYDTLQVYEFLFPDSKTRKFQIVGASE